MYEIGNVLDMTNGTRFVVADKAVVDQKNYYLIINYNEKSNWMLVYEQGTTLVEELDESVKKRVFHTFKENK